MRKISLSLLTMTFLAGSLRAEWIELPWAAAGATLPVWRPDDFAEGKKYPAIVWYGPDGAKPEAAWIHRMTGGGDFVLVGMGYRQVDESAYTQLEIADGLGLLKALKQTLTGSLGVEPGKIHVGGFGKGGWHAAMLLDRDPDLAGGLIVGAGISEDIALKAKLSDQKRIYVGSGRSDPNYPRALAALVYFRGLGADVVLEDWEGGHVLPEEAPETLRQWLRMRVGGAGLRAEAERWCERRLEEIEATEDKVERWYGLEKFVSRPFVKWFGEKAGEEAKAMAAKLEQDVPEVAAESALVKRLQAILARECRDLQLRTVQSASQAFLALAREAGRNSKAGQAAAKDYERTVEILKTAKIERKEAPAREPVRSVPGPSGPSTNPERTPFVPPGIDVKPAD